MSVSPLGSLSSPSPSPPPNPIDESELSELTDDDHADTDDRRPPPQRQRRTRRAAPTRAPPNSRRKKRGGLVPAPMWGWAYKGPSSSAPAPLLSPPPSLPGTSRTEPLPNLKSHSPSPDPEEEEEEELPTPPRAMEEEEAEDPDPRKPSRSRRKKVVVPIPFDPDKMPRSKRGVKVTPKRSKAETDRFLLNLWEQGHKLYDSNAPTSDEDVKPHQDPPTLPPEEDDEDSDSVYTKRYPSQSPKFKRRKKLPKGFDPNDPPPLPRSKRGGRPPLARISLSATNEMLVQLWKEGYKVYDPKAPTSDEDDDQSGSGVDVTPSQSNSSDSDKEDEMDVDDDALSSAHHSPPRPILDTNLKTSAPDLLESFPPSMRASLDPTASPPDDSLPTRPIPDEDLDQDNDPGSPDDDDRHPEELDGDEDDDAHPVEPSQPPSPTPIIEPEPEQEDEDPDLQPAHRAEALDVLATIELKFALLREKVYVEKMEGLAWEETLVWDGTHPELHHLQDELTKRRDKRLMLASKKRTYEIDTLAKKTREEELWCWEGWDIAHTELQTEMIAETNRKRRKLERERRTVERPPGARRIPTAILNPPPAPTLRQIANTFPLPSHLSHFTANKKTSYGRGLGIYPGFDGLSGATAYPDLASLSPHEIAADIDFLFQHRRLGFGFGMGFGPPMGVPLGVGIGPPGFGPAAIGFGGPNPTPGFGINGLGIGPGEGYPPNAGLGGSAAQIGGPPLVLGSSGPVLGPPPSSAPSSVPSQSTPNIVAGPGPNSEGSSYSQPAMGVFQAPPTGPSGYPVGSGGNGASIVIGPGGTTSTPVMGPGVTRTQRPAFVERERDLQREREREMIQRDRDFREPPRERELAVQREREIRERERDFGPSLGPGYPTWNPKPPGGMDWEPRRREERDRMERNERERERERSQAQPIVPTPTHRHLHPHNHSHSHTHPLQHPLQPPHQPHPVHGHQSHQHPPHHLSHAHQHQHGTSHGPAHHHVGQHHHHRHHHHVVHHHHSSVPGSGTNSSGPDGASPLPQGPGPAPGVQTMEIINLSANTSSKSHWKRDESKLGNSVSGSRPPSTHPLPSHYEERERDRERERERERDRPIATPFVLAPSHHTMSSAASPPRHGWTPGPGEPPTVPPYPPPERFHTPSFSTTNGLSHPRPLTTSPPRPPVSSPSIAVPPPPSSTGPFARKGSPKLAMYSPRLAGPGVVPTGPGVPGVLSTGGILTSGPGMPPGPGIAPAPDGYAGRASPLTGYVSKVGVEP